MNFLQPALLAALPLAALPLLIHLIYQRRYQTLPWGAMMFLLTAHGTSQGYARLRRWLILLFRTLVILGLILALSRPLDSGAIGSALGTRTEVVIVLLDRSPSMQQRDPTTLVSKLETGRAQLVRTLRTLPASRWVVIDSASVSPREIESPDALTDLPGSGPVDAAADIPAMLQAAHDYIADTRPGSVDIWVASDLRLSDWDPDSGRWPSLRGSFARLAQDVRLHLLTYPQPAPQNLSLQVTHVRRQVQGDNAALLVSLRLQRTAVAEAIDVPVRFEIQGARSELTVRLEDSQLEWTEHPIPLDPSLQQGWGRVSIPADTNAADNEGYFAFTFDAASARHAVIVAEDPLVAESLRLAASIAPDRHTDATVQVIDASEMDTLDWPRVALLLWQGNLPDPPLAARVERFVGRGGHVLFFPPRASSSNRLFGVGWGTWMRSAQPKTCDVWRDDQDLLANTLSGSPLPVDQLHVWGHAPIVGSVTSLASLEGGAAILARAATERGGVYFCATTPHADDSSLTANGVVLYVMVQRALQQGAAALANTHQRTAGASMADQAADWERLVGDDAASPMTHEYGFHRGVYQAAGRRFAVNRPISEDQPAVLSDARLADMLGDLRWTRVDDAAGSVGPLVQEVWRLFLASAIAAMLLEAGLSLPSKNRLQRSGG